MRPVPAILLLFSLSASCAPPTVAVRQIASIPSGKSIARMVPASGKLGERELTLMAIARRPELEKLRGAITTATAQKRAAHDLVNPELRLTYGQAEDDRIGTTTKVVAPAKEDDTWGVLLRFTLPNPWERKARIERAAAEISLAEADYYAGEDVVVRKVRGACQELAILHGKLDAQTRRKAGFESYRDWIEKQNVPQLGLDLASARAKVYGTLSDIRGLESNITAMRDDLAAFCGLADASRIETSIKTRLVKNPAALDVEYLTSIAMLYRSDVLGDKARIAIARAQLSAVKAQRIPVSTFVDFGFAQTETLHRSGQKDESFARIGVSFPLWDWVGYNKQHTVHEAASQSLERQLAMQQTVISNEVKQAVKRLAAAEAQLGVNDKDLADIHADLKKSMADAQIVTLNVDDLAKGARIEQDFKDLAQQMELSRFSSLSAYQEALMALEKTLGIRLERALSQAGRP